MTACGISPRGIHLWDLRGVRGTRYFRLGATASENGGIQSPFPPRGKRERKERRGADHAKAKEEALQSISE